MTSDRRRDLLRILEKASASSQGDIVRMLLEKGHEVTQATVSRELARVGAVKVRRGSQTFYTLPDSAARVAAGEGEEEELLTVLSGLATSIVAASALVVVKTDPGHAPVLARSIDLSGASEVAGTVAGDDTIFVATSSAESAKRLAERWETGERKGTEVA